MWVLKGDQPQKYKTLKEIKGLSAKRQNLLHGLMAVGFYSGYRPDDKQTSYRLGITRMNPLPKLDDGRTLGHA